MNLAYVKVGTIALAVLTVSALGVWVKLLRAERDSLAAAVDTATVANARQAAALDALQADQAKAEARVAELMGDLTRISTRDRANRKRLSDLEASNADVRAYLDRAVPVDLRGVLSDEGGGAAGGGEAAPACPAPSAVRPAGAGGL